jgi:hypothetical protein
MEQPARLATMQEPALSFEGVTLSPQKEAVRIFYKDMWDHADKSLIPKIFHEGFTFRGSLGPTLVGHDQFAGYVDSLVNRWAARNAGCKEVGDYMIDAAQSPKTARRDLG